MDAPSRTTSRERLEADPRAVRTRARLRTALVTLMAEKGYDAVTVQDILDRAQVGRTTFYAHYLGKDALHEDGFRELERWLTAEARAASGARRLAFSLPMFEHAEAHRKLYRSLVGRRAAAMVQRRIRQLLAAAVRAELAPEASRLDAPLDLVVEHVVGSYHAVLVWWLDHRTGLSPAQIDAVFRRLTLPTLEAIGLDA